MTDTAIRFYSTNGQVPEVDLARALIQGMAGDRGLYMPRPLPSLPDGLLARARDLSYAELAAAMLTPYSAGLWSADEMATLCADAYDFEVPVEEIAPRRHILRLDRGPTASFKDFAARFMARALGRLVRASGRPLLILVATSGDTGSAIAHAFLGVAGIRVVVLFPRAEVSDRQRRQMTTLGDNVRTLALPAKFDDCQALVKTAFADGDLAGLNLSSANSINIGRLLPQSVYYAWAASRVADVGAGEPVVFSVPSGNFGDLMGGLLARHAGLPVARFAVATNANDEVPRFLQTGSYEPLVPSRVCISNAMNVGHPSNLARLVDLYGGHMDERGRLLRPPDMGRMKQDLYAVSIDDERTRATIGEVWRRHGVLIEPHGAVGMGGLDELLDHHPELRDRAAICLETAHPAKFPDEVRAATGQEPPLPTSLMGLADKTEHFEELEPDYAAFKAWLQALPPA